ncbi:MAG: ATP-dependent RecD-like DNA helicase [Clostridia bacterium]|nr:ATP-dependent RecD-like DNA helicase [Clostridia bacterium]
MEIQGVITEIIYQNEVNSYTIAEIEMEEEETTIVGYLPFINIGDTLKLTGKYVEHRDYGMQFKIETFEKVMPQTLDALERYLSNGAIKGVGPATARKIIKKFGEETIDVLRYYPEKLATVSGISMAKATEISHQFVENWEVWQIVGFLEKFGIGTENAKKVYDLFGIRAIEEIQANPYILIDIVRGIEFRKIDKMALDLGIGLNNDKRVESAIKYALINITYNGHCCAQKEQLIEFVQTLIGVEKQDVENSLINLKMKNNIVIEQRDEFEWVYLQSFYVAEKNVAENIMRLQKAKNTKKIMSIKTEIRIVEQDLDIELSEKQKEAVEMISNQNVSIITGGPGTGKTTIIKTILEIYKKKKYKVVLAAPTGRAAKRMTETTGEEASTLHRLLEIGKIDDNAIYKDEKEIQIAPIDADVVIVDEMSMVDIFLMNYLSKSIYMGTKLILVGDFDQLSSVGPGSVLKDLIESNRIETIHLDKVFRQAAKSKIIVNAHRVNKGEGFISKEEEEMNSKQDFFFIKQISQERMLEEVISLCNGRLQKFGDYDFFQNIQVLTPTKKGSLGTKELNKSLQAILNAAMDGKRERVNGGAIFREGDRVMQIKNNYDMFWERKYENSDEYENGNGIFNGEIGRIVRINDIEKIVKVKFDDDKICWYEFSELDQLEHSYCITIHKAQGSEFDVVIMVIPPSAPMLLTRNLLYTGITRAKKLLIVISNPNIIDYMTNNVDSKKRNTGLCFKLRCL